MTTVSGSQARSPLSPPADWQVEEYADPELLANSEGNHRVVERDRARLRRRKAEIAAHRADRA